MEKKTYQQGFIDFTGKNILKKKNFSKSTLFWIKKFYMYEKDNR